TSAASTAQSGQHLVKGLFLIILGLLVGYMWLWGNALQITTSEAWILGTKNVTLSPQLSVFLQITTLFDGHHSLKETIAYGWGWLNQVLLLVFSIGIEHAIVEKKRARTFKWICACFVILNSLADLSYGTAFGGMWQPWAFAAICCFATFSLGVAAIGLMVEGFKQIF